jgi:predicted acyl esterase
MSSSFFLHWIVTVVDVQDSDTKSDRVDIDPGEKRRRNERVIIFHSEPFTHDVEVTGQMKLKLVIQSDAADFDLWAQILMIKPDGSTIRLGEDIRRVRFRNSFFKQELLKPDQIVTIPFEFLWMARRIPAGARLRLTIAPLNSAAYQKNYNTGGRIGCEKIEDARIAHIKLFHDTQHTSVLELPLAASSGGQRPLDLRVFPDTLAGHMRFEQKTGQLQRRRGLFLWLALLLIVPGICALSDCHAAG